MLKLTKGTADRLLESLRSRALREAEALYAEVETENAYIVQKRPELSVTMAGESRCLRVIVHTIIKEMSRQIV
jgi:serine/threonine-protein kinase HipA